MADEDGKENPELKFFFIIIDLDDFKNINDRYGHQYKDEFVILTKDMSRNTVEEQLKKLMETNHFSAGVVQWHSSENIKDIFDRADNAMVLFATSGGSGFGNTVRELAPSATNAVI